MALKDILGSISKGWTFQEAGFTKGTRNKFSSAVRDMHLPIAVKGWSGWKQFYESLPEELKDKDIFRSKLGFRFIPTGHGLSWLPDSAGKKAMESLSMNEAGGELLSQVRKLANILGNVEDGISNMKDRAEFVKGNWHMGAAQDITETAARISRLLKSCSWD